MISIPKNNISKVLKVADRHTPHNTKNMRAKYSDTLAPTFSTSLPLSKKYNNVQDKATVINVRLKLLNDSIYFTSTAKNDSPLLSSRQLAIIAITSPAMAQYFGVDLLLKNTPPNINIIPQIAVNIIAFIFSPQSVCDGLFKITII